VGKMLEIPPRTATFSTKNILVSKQLLVPKQKNKMKKNILWAMMLWTLPDLLAQTHLNLTIGGGAHEMLVGDRIIESNKRLTVNRLTPPAAHAQIGVNLFRYGLKKQLIYGIGLDYHYMFLSDFQAIETFYLYSRPQSSASNYSLWSLPMYVQWNAKYVKPLLGLTLDYKSLSDTPYDRYWASGCIDYIAGTIIPNEPKLVADVKLSFLAGLEWSISNKYSVRLNYVHQLLGNERWAVRWDESYSQSDYKIKNYRLEFTFVAHLKEF
jgi:hypothetical protein